MSAFAERFVYYNTWLLLSRHRLALTNGERWMYSPKRTFFNSIQLLLSRRRLVLTNGERWWPAKNLPVYRSKEI
jgi:hypothetical protein